VSEAEAALALSRAATEEHRQRSDELQAQLAGSTQRVEASEHAEAEALARVAELEEQLLDVKRAAAERGESGRGVGVGVVVGAADAPLKLEDVFAGSNVALSSLAAEVARSANVSLGSVDTDSHSASAPQLGRASPEPSRVRDRRGSVRTEGTDSLDGITRMRASSVDVTEDFPRSDGDGQAVGSTDVLGDVDNGDYSFHSQAWSVGDEAADGNDDSNQAVCDS
jgi:hypothetical protein